MTNPTSSSEQYSSKGSGNRVLTGCCWTITDWIWFQQEDSPHDALWPQGVPRPERLRRRHAPHAQQDLRCRVRLSKIPPPLNLEPWESLIDAIVFIGLGTLSLPESVSRSLQRPRL